MVYRMTVRSNPRVLAVYLLMPLVIGVGVAAPFVIGVFYGLVALVAAGFFVWSMVRLTRRQLATRVETLTDEILFRLHGDEKILVPWEKVRFSGVALVTDKAGSPVRKGRRLFIYNEEEDRLLTLTDEFENMDGLAAELRGKTDFRELVLAEGETLKQKLRELVGPR
jgi:hypothetical protein